MKRLIDLSHRIDNQTIGFPNAPVPEITEYQEIKDSRFIYNADSSYHIGQINIVANTGTYIDVPFHRYDYGKDLADIRLENVADLEGIKITVPKNVKAIGSDFFVNRNLENRCVLIETGWSQFWGTRDYFNNAPYLTEDAAVYLMDKRVKMVGIESCNIDNIEDASRPAHSILLDDDIFILEHLVHLEKLPAEGFRFFAVPPKITGLGSFPVRAFALVEL
jgi:kynurenine formamidase